MSETRRAFAEPSRRFPTSPARGTRSGFTQREYSWLWFASALGAAFYAHGPWMQLAGMAVLVALVDYLRPDRPWHWGGMAAIVFISTSLACLLLLNPFRPERLAFLILPVAVFGAACWHLQVQPVLRIKEQLSWPSAKMLIYVAALTGFLPGILVNERWYFSVVALALFAGLARPVARHWRAALWIAAGYTFGFAVQTGLGPYLGLDTYRFSLLGIAQTFVYGGALSCVGVYAGAAMRWTYERRASLLRDCQSLWRRRRLH